MPSLCWKKTKKLTVESKELEARRSASHFRQCWPRRCWYPLLYNTRMVIFVKSLPSQGVAGVVGAIHFNSQSTSVPQGITIGLAKKTSVYQLSLCSLFLSLFGLSCLYLIPSFSFGTLFLSQYISRATTAMRSALKEPAKSAALKRDEFGFSRALWEDGKQGAKVRVGAN